MGRTVLLQSVVPIALALLVGCSTDMGRFTLLSTKNVEISRVDLRRIEYHRDVEGEDGRHWFLFVPLGGAPTVERATDRCLATGFGDFMTSARVEARWWTVFLVSYEAFRITGDVGNSLGAGAREMGPDVTVMPGGDSYRDRRR